MSMTASSMIIWSSSGGRPSKSLAGFVDGLVEEAPADGVVNEFRETGPLPALSAKQGAHGEVGLFGDDDAPADGSIVRGAGGSASFS